MPFQLHVLSVNRNDSTYFAHSQGSCEDPLRKLIRKSWFTWETNKVRDTEFALTMEAAGALSNCGRCSTLGTFSSGS